MVERNYAIESPKQLLSESQAKQELIRLDKEITYHDKLYYEKDSPTISDAVYDGLVNRAREIVRQFPLLHGIVKKLQNTVGSKKSSSFLPFHHSRPMLSLENGFLRDDLAKFVERVQKATTMIDPAKYEGSIQNDIHGNVEFIVEPKIDGLSLAVRYRGGVLLSAGTRGDGTEGEDVTSNALTIPNIPKKIDIEIVGKLLHDFVSESATEEEGDSISISAKNTNTIVEVRGEVYISKSDFEQLNSDRIASNQTRFSTPRNAAAGSLRQQDVSKAAERRLNFFAYALHIYEENSSPSSGVHIGAGNEAESSQPYSNHRNAVFIPASQSDTLKALSKLGFQIAQPFGISDDLDGVWRLCSNLEQERPKLGMLYLDVLNVCMYSCPSVRLHLHVYLRTFGL
jgi:DNA ligase (NAD+)